MSIKAPAPPTVPPTMDPVLPLSSLSLTGGAAAAEADSEGAAEGAPDGPSLLAVGGALVVSLDVLLEAVELEVEVELELELEVVLDLSDVLEDEAVVSEAVLDLSLGVPTMVGSAREVAVWVSATAELSRARAVGAPS